MTLERSRSVYQTITYLNTAVTHLVRVFICIVWK